jgi:hypothetical protein
MGWGGGGGGE